MNGTTVPMMTGQRISAAMEKKGMSIKDLAEKIDSTYEHMRKIARGEAVPAKYKLRIIAAVLDLDPKDLAKLAVADTITKKYGSIPYEISHKNPELIEIERAWPDLTSQQKQDATAMISLWAKRSRIGGTE